ncbi:MAG: tetratricopeptide repeat protein [Candidatus Latescibacterota bacterium]|jgi:tetratricopeptide (TPR) repeat protein|tara:strand:- start:35 stop:706 length:672 start_codon:yes stop_codon:yes gene_type:complete
MIDNKINTTLISMLLCVLLCVGSALGQGTAEELFEMGYEHQTGKIPDEKRALAYYGQALKLKPALYEALFNAALVHHGRGEYTRAQNYFVKAARSAPNMGEQANDYEAMARNGLGACYQMQGKYENAEKQFDVARRMNSGFVEAHYNYINILVRNERFDDAKAALTVAEKMAPSDRYEKFKGRLTAKEQKDELSGFGSVGGLIAFIFLILAYGLYIRRSKGRV